MSCLAQQSALLGFVVRAAPKSVFHLLRLERICARGCRIGVGLVSRATLAFCSSCFSSRGACALPHGPQVSDSGDSVRFSLGLCLESKVPGRSGRSMLYSLCALLVSAACVHGQVSVFLSKLSLSLSLFLASLCSGLRRFFKLFVIVAGSHSGCGR